MDKAESLIATWRERAAAWPSCERQWTGEDMKLAVETCANELQDILTAPPAEGGESPWRVGRTVEYKRGQYYLSHTVWEDGHEEVEIHRCAPEQLYQSEGAEIVKHSCDPKQFPEAMERFARIPNTPDEMEVANLELAAKAIVDMQKAWYWKDEDKQIAHALLEAAVRIRAGIITPAPVAQSAISLRKVLGDARRAIASLPADALGRDLEIGYWYRDELLANIDKAVTTSEACVSPSPSPSPSVDAIAREGDSWRSQKAQSAIHDAAELIANCYCHEDDTFHPEVQRLVAVIVRAVDGQGDAIAVANPATSESTGGSGSSGSSGPQVFNIGHNQIIDHVHIIRLEEKES